MLRLTKNDRGKFPFQLVCFGAFCEFLCVIFSSNSYHMILVLSFWFYGDDLLIDSFNFSRFNFLLFWCIILNLVKTRILWYFSVLLNWILDISIWFMITILVIFPFDSWLQFCDISIFVNWILDTNFVIFCHFFKLDSWYQLCDILLFC